MRRFLGDEAQETPPPVGAVDGLDNIGNLPRMTTRSDDADLLDHVLIPVCVGVAVHP